MVKRRQQPNKRQQRSQDARRPASTNSRAVFTERSAQPKKEYGPPFVVLENENLDTFHYVQGAWKPYERRIDDCRLDCQVKKLPQKVNKMTRYEIRLPLN